MSFNESQISSSKSSNFGDIDDALMILSPYREEKLKEILSLIPHNVRPKCDRLFRIFVKEEIELSHKKQATTTTHGSSSCELRTLQLMISKIGSPLLTGDLIKGIGGMPIEVTLIDTHTKDVVKSGPEASGRVELVAVDAMADGAKGNEYKSILFRQMEGNRSVLVGKLHLNLIEGTAVLPVVSLARNKRWMKISNIRLQARFVDDFNGVQVKDAQTDPFILKDRRNGAYTKHLIPSLHDEVWRLYKVGKKGSLVRSLIEEKIKTVGDFIICLFLHPQYLEEIFSGAKHAKSFKVTVKHALKCPSKLKYCSSFDQKNGVVFDVSGQVFGSYVDGQFLSSDALSDLQKGVSKQLVTTAFENWGNVTIVNEDQLVAHCSPHVLNRHSSLSNASYRYENTDKSIIRDGYDLHINEDSLFCNMFIDGQHQNQQVLPEPLKRPFNDIYYGFKSLCTSSQHQPVRFYKRWRVMFCVITFTMGSLCDTRAHKKQRL